MIKHMKPPVRWLRSGIAILIVLLMLTSATAYAVGDVVYTSSRWLADNLEYVNTISWSTSLGRTESFAIRMTGPGDAYPIVLSGETVYGTTRISSIVSYAESLGRNVLAVVNADFFSMQSGIPLGIVIEDGVYKSSPSGRSAVCFGYDGGVYLVEETTVEISLYNNGSEENEGNSGKVVGLSNFNKLRVDTGGMYLFSEAFSSISTRTASPGWFVRLRIIEGIPSVSGTMTLEVTETFTSDGAVPIGDGYMILSAAIDGGYIEEYEKFAVGDIVTLTTDCNDERLIIAQYATGAGDVLISNGVKTDAEEWDSALMTSRAPRTAFGIRADGTVVSYVIDGRSSNHSIGMTMIELVDEMQRQGCIYAVNFDGGGSTALSLRIPGESRASVINQPSDGNERGCATYILFVVDAVPGGAARNLSLRNNGAVVLAGSSVDLSFIATDRGYMPARLPGDIQITPLDPDGYIDETLYTTGDTAGTQRLSLSSPSTGAHGTGEIFVITRPTSVTVSRSGSSTPLSSVKLFPGERLELDIVATYYRRAVTSQLHAFEYIVSGEIGEMVEPGVFEAWQEHGQTGTITVDAGGRSVDIKVEIGGVLDMRDHWARVYAEQLATMGIVTGVTPTEYDPERMMSRGDYMLMLYRAAGLPEVDEIASFDDVPQDAYYAKAIAWAKNAGIAEGDEGNEFMPQSPLTRQDAFTFTYRILDVLEKQYTDGTQEDINGFPDADTLVEYAIIPTATLINLGIVEGMDGLLSPDTTLTRGQMAKLMVTITELP